MSLKSFFKRYLPERHKVQDHKHLRHFGELLHDPNIWHLNRYSTAGGVAVGLFCAFIPVPVQMLIAAGIAILIRVNLPIAVVFAWISNPITIAPLFILAYKLGAWILNIPTRQIAFEFTLHWFTERMILIWEPLLLGCLILGTLSAVIGYYSTLLLWRLALVRKWKDRRASKQNFGKDN